MSDMLRLVDESPKRGSWLKNLIDSEDSFIESRRQAEAYRTFRSRSPIGRRRQIQNLYSVGSNPSASTKLTRRKFKHKVQSTKINLARVAQLEEATDLRSVL